MPQLVQLGLHLLVDGVAHRRAVERHPRDAVRFVHQKGLVVGHGCRSLTVHLGRPDRRISVRCTAMPQFGERHCSGRSVRFSAVVQRTHGSETRACGLRRRQSPLRDGGRAHSPPPLRPSESLPVRRDQRAKETRGAQHDHRVHPEPDFRSDRSSRRPHRVLRRRQSRRKVTPRAHG